VGEISPKSSIYLMKNVSLFVRYAFSSCNSYGHRTFHGTSLGPGKDQEGTGAPVGGWGRDAWVKFHPADLSLR